MTEFPDPTPPTLPVVNLTPVRVAEAQPPPPEMRADGPRDLSPISWGATYDTSDDFRPMVVPSAEGADPKDLSAVESADFSMRQEDLIPQAEPENPSPSLSDAQEESVPVVKAPTLTPLPEI